MSAPYKYLRNTISGVTMTVTDKEAEKYLSHPVFSNHMVEVDTPKDEVLTEPYTIDDGERKPVEDEKPKRQSRAKKEDD